MNSDILDIRGLSVRFDTPQGAVHPLRDVDITVPKGEIVGIVGESGSGKSTLALAIMRLLPANAVIQAEKIDFHGENLLAADAARMQELRGDRISMVFQDPMTSLNPVRSIGHQMLDIQYRDGSVGRGEKLARAEAALKRVGIPDAGHQLKNYPFQFSGGMRQRIAIAMSLLQEPDLLIADEITTALDVTLEQQVLHLLLDLRRELNGSILFISHNLGAIAEICDRVVVLYAGEVVEQGTAEDVFYRPKHPYTQALVECDPARIATVTRELPVIPGDVPNLKRLPSGCIFEPRCRFAFESCRSVRPADWRSSASQVARCHLLARQAA